MVVQEASPMGPTRHMSYHSNFADKHAHDETTSNSKEM